LLVSPTIGINRSIFDFGRATGHSLIG
jgi:hypothetical protein